MHSLNGNKEKKNKLKTHVKVAQLNTGNSLFKNTKDLLITEMEESNPDILTLTWTLVSIISKQST